MHRRPPRRDSFSPTCHSGLVPHPFRRSGVGHDDLRVHILRRRIIPHACFRMDGVPNATAMQHTGIRAPPRVFAPRRNLSKTGFFDKLPNARFEGRLF